MKVFKKPLKNLDPMLGDKYFYDGIQFRIKYVNNGWGWLFPVIDDPDDTKVARHIAYGKVDKEGNMVRL